MKSPQLFTLSPLDGRYKENLIAVTPTFSELNLILTRLAIEIEWFKTLAQNPDIQEIKFTDDKSLDFLNNLITNFDEQDAIRVKDLEKQTNHDVKAIEYFLKEKLAASGELNAHKEFVHFGCTSDDINNLSYALILTKAREEILSLTMKNIINNLSKMAQDYAKIPMLSHTHGQAATPSTVGKEMANFAYRLNRQYDYFINSPILGKFNGAVGNFNACQVAYPELAWQEICQKFVESLGLVWNPYTTQIEPHDWQAEYCDILARFNTILIGLCRDMWNYISIGYFKQKSNPSEIGSSTMPHKINPIDFENAEGNLGLANALLNHFSSKLPISRFQRDLTDSTVMRNFGVAIGHSALAYQSLCKGLNKIEVDTYAVKQDLKDHWEVLAEAVQTVMRRYSISDPYEKMKTLTRGQKLDRETLHSFINQLNIPVDVKQELLNMTPADYIGKAADLAAQLECRIKKS